MSPPRIVSHLALFASVLSLTCCAGDDPAEEEKSAVETNWVGQTFLLQVPKNNWYVPRGVGKDIGDFVPGFMFRVDSATDTTMSITMGTAKADGTQEMCGQTVAFTAAAPAYPGSVVGPGALPIYVTNQSVSVNSTVMNLQFDNVLPDPAAPMTEGTINAVMDFREVVFLFTALGSSDPTTACNAVSESYPGTTCEPCPSDGQAFCLTLKADKLGAVAAAAPLVDVPTSSCTNVIP